MKHKRMINGVLGLPVRSDGQMLLTRRHSPDNKAWHNKWQIAGGGMEFGESPEQTLSRELQEELKVSARILHPHPIVKTKLWYGGEADKRPDTHLTLLCYIVEINGQKVDISGDEETNDFGWYSLEDALKTDYLPLTDDFVKDAYDIIARHDILNKI